MPRNVFSITNTTRLLQPTICCTRNTRDWVWYRRTTRSTYWVTKNNNCWKIQKHPINPNINLKSLPSQPQNNLQSIIPNSNWTVSKWGWIRPMYLSHPDNKDSKRKCNWIRPCQFHVQLTTLRRCNNHKTPKTLNHLVECWRSHLLIHITLMETVEIRGEHRWSWTYPRLSSNLVSTSHMSRISQLLSAT